MDEWKLVQYNSVVDKFLVKHKIDLNDPDEDKESNLERRLGLLLAHGNNCGIHVSKPLGNALFELIAQEDDKQIRLAYFFMPQKTIGFVHAFIKKTKQTSLKDMNKLKKNKKLAEKEGSKIYEYDFTT